MYFLQRNIFTANKTFLIYKYYYFLFLYQNQGQTKIYGNIFYLLSF